MFLNFENAGMVYLAFFVLAAVLGMIEAWRGFGPVSMHDRERDAW
jgi:hypothetical protein